MSSVVVLVLSWNGQHYLHACLDALSSQQYDDQYALLVVDNGSTDNSAALVQTEFPQVALIQNQTNLGFAAGNNVGMRALLAGSAPAPIDFVPDSVVLLNQDTVVAPDWLQQLVQVFERHNDVGIAGCKIFFPDGTLQHTGGSLMWPLAAGTHRGAGEHDTGQYDEEQAVEYVTGAAMAVRTSVLAKIGFFDEGFSPAYFEDADLCYRARSAGFTILYTPAAQLQHDESTSLTAQSATHQRAYHRNRLRFVLKHGPLDTLLNDFLPAEREEIERWSIRNSLARKLAYLDAMLTLPDVLRQRDDYQEAISIQPQLRAMLQSLHHTVVEEERMRRAESGYRVDEQRKPEPQPDEQSQQDAVVADVDLQDDEQRTEQETRLQEVAPPSLAHRPPEQPESQRDADAEAAPGPAVVPAHVETTDRSTPPALVAAEQPQPEPALDLPLVDVAAIMRQVRRQISERQGHQVDHELAQALNTTNEQWDKVYEPLHLAPGHSLPGRLWDVLRMRLHQEVRSYLDPMIYRQTELNSSIVRALNNIARRSSFFARATEIEALHDEIIQLREQIRQLQEQNK